MRFALHTCHAARAIKLSPVALEPFPCTEGAHIALLTQEQTAKLASQCLAVYSREALEDAKLVSDGGGGVGAGAAIRVVLHPCVCMGLFQKTFWGSYRSKSPTRRPCKMPQNKTDIPTETPNHPK